MNRNRISLLALLALSVMLTLAATAFADYTPLASDNIRSASVTLTNNGTSLTAKAEINGKNLCDRIGASSFSIQEKQNGVWVTVKSAAAGYNSDSTRYTDSLSYTGISGREYRAKASVYATLGGTTSYAYPVSASRTLP